jgi:hypothetical protein
MSDRTAFSTDTHQELRTLPFTQDILYNGFLVSPDGTRLYSRGERLNVASNALLANLPVDITTGSSWASAPIPGGPIISTNGQKILCCNNLAIIDTVANTSTQPGIGGTFLSDISLTPDESKILRSEYSFANGALVIYDANTFERLKTISGMGDFAGEIVFSKDGQRAVIGSAGNAQSGAGKVTVIDLDRLEILSQISLSLADNLTSSGDDEFFISSGASSRLGVDVYRLNTSGQLERTKSFFLGINKFIPVTGRPSNDQIHRIIYKP